MVAPEAYQPKREFMITAKAPLVVPTVISSAKHRSLTGKLPGMQPWLYTKKGLVLVREATSELYIFIT